MHESRSAMPYFATYNDTGMVWLHTGLITLSSGQRVLRIQSWY